MVLPSYLNVSLNLNSFIGMRISGIEPKPEQWHCPMLPLNTKSAWIGDKGIGPLRRTYKASHATVTSIAFLYSLYSSHLLCLLLVHMM